MYTLSALELHRQFKEGTLSATEIIQYFLTRAKNHNEKTGAFLRFMEEQALKKASLLDEKRKKKQPLGKLAGVPIAIKDNIHIKGEITTCGSKFLKNYQALFNATVIELLDQEDAIFIGKTNLDEFAMGSSTEFSAFQKTRNPWNLDYTPGGSSGGSAVCVASRCAPLSLGSDTGGSIRQPAAFTGIFGFKPTYGRVSRWGLVAFGSSLDQIGPFASYVEDIALSMEVMGRHCPRDSTSLYKEPESYLSSLKQSIQGKKIGVPWHFLESLSPEMKKNFTEALQVYQDLGVTLVDVDLDELRYSIPTYYIIAPAEASTNLARFDGIQFSTRSKKATTVEEIYEMSKEEGFGPEVKQRILLGTFVLSSGFQDAYYKKALRVRELIIQKFQSTFKSCDLIAMPTSPFGAFPLGSISDPIELYLQDLYTISANLAGLPAISIPCGFNSQGLPLGLQLLGPPLAESKVLQFAYQFQEKKPYHKHIPAAFDQEVKS
jgi:aspartyl-tRNA(Asn)/glutamyl-tRNA(Gln) amidotransferase subunit A